ncbi:hypothetical protein AG0111_0g2884 [Alternaria gaisen]|uniref:Uncharacterized protein n=1 Tax=Alternaria gaisen TaxID=167740 RepID=A0ACB6FWL6_9PLEO|nr:hypothetical protein AG0111_0g2884 [Alternaria gaisen]
MRFQTPLASILPEMVNGRLFAESEYLQDFEDDTTTSASPASLPTSSLPVVTPTGHSKGIELHQAQGVAQVRGAPPDQQPRAPIIVTVTATAKPVTTVKPIPPPAPVPPAPVPSVNVAGTADADVTRLAVPTSTFSNVPFYTVVWAETWIGGTYSTWWPHTISLDFEPAQTHVPLPGVGVIGMGTLTGRAGVTRTVVVNSAPTSGLSWSKGLAAVVGVGMAGIVV